jgi:YVTN family beta-propeller protein
MSFLRKNLIIILVLCLTIAVTGQVSIIETIDLGVQPAGIEVNPATNRVYVSNLARVFEIDGATDAVIDTIWFAIGVDDIDVDTVRNRIYAGAGSESDGIVYVIDGGTNSMIADISVEYYLGLAVNQITNKIYVAHAYYDNVFVIDGSTNSVIDTILVEDQPLDVSVNPVTNRIYSANQNDISVIDGEADSVITTISVAAGPGMIGVNTQANRFYVPRKNSGDVVVFDGATNTGIDTIEVGNYPMAVGVNPQINRIYVTNFNDGSVSVIDAGTGSVVSAIGVGDGPRHISVNPKTNKIYVTHYSDGTVWVLEDLTGGVEVSPREPSHLGFSVSPNPFSGSTEFVLNVPRDANDARFSIYNVSGTLIKSFSISSDYNSPITLRWDGEGDNGKKCASGVYLGVLKAGDYKPSKGKILLVN